MFRSSPDVTQLLLVVLVVLHQFAKCALALSVPFRGRYHVFNTHPLQVYGSRHENYVPAKGYDTKSSRPPCARQWDYCVHNHDYPKEQVQSITDHYYSDTLALYGQVRSHLPQDLARFQNTSESVVGGHFICPTEVLHLRVGWARNVQSTWMVIVNTDQFHQSVRLEQCRFQDRSCDYIPPCLHSVCKQRYAVAQLVAVDPSRPDLKPILDKFVFPSGCSCFVENYLPRP